MRIVSVRDLEAGMVCAKDVATLDGRKLLKAGSKLGPDNLRTLKAWGIEQIEILSQDQPSIRVVHATPDQKTRETANKVQQQVRQRLRHNDVLRSEVRMAIRVIENQLLKEAAS